MKKIHFLLLALLLFGFEHTSAKPYAPIFEDLNYLDLKLNSQSEEAQLYFNQGMLLFYDFDFAESIRSFKAAIKADPNCGICFAGLSLALSSKSDGPVTASDRKQALKYIKNGLQLSNLTPLEEDLLNAVSNRLFRGIPEEQLAQQTLYHQNQLLSIEERVSFMNSMAKLKKKYPDNTEILAIYAYSLFDLCQNNFFDAKEKTPSKFTNELIEIVRELLDRAPSHPAAMHYYIHAIEQSNNPDEASDVARRIRLSHPNLPHLSSIASHIFLLTGHIHDATDANEQAIAAYERYKAACNKQGFRPAANYLEQDNYQSLWISASLEGRYMLAKLAADKLLAITPPFLANQESALQQFLTTRYLNEVRFKHWDSILSFEEPDPNYLYQRALWYYAAGMALVNTKRLPEAEKALLNLRLIVERGANPEVLGAFGHAQLKTSESILAANLATKQGKKDLILHYWQEAKSNLEQQMPQSIPMWSLETYRGLSKAYTIYKQETKAQQVLGVFIEKFPKTPWVYPDLVKLLSLSDQSEKAQDTHKDFLKLWRFADVNFPG